MKNKKKLNRLTEIKLVERRNGNNYWLYKCNCGNKKIILRTSVAAGRTKSCGCLLKESVSKRMTKHGMCKERFYKTWENMKTRCYNKSYDSYKNYGGRGISVCKKWTSFNGFKNDMYKHYLIHVEAYGKKNTTIDRINNNGNYCKKNCRWATIEQQNNNKRKIHEAFDENYTSEIL